jgi:hypothetical protein
MGGYQINAHGTYIKLTDQACSDIIVRDESAKAIYASSCVMLIFPSAEEIEVFACQEGEQILIPKLKG